MKAKKLIEVALPIKEISAESARDGRLTHGHIKSMHQWWARRPLPTCRAVVFASLIPDPLDENCPVAFCEAIDELLNRGKAKAIYKPYADIPYTAILDPVEDNRRNRLLAFIGQFSDKCQKNMLAGKATASKDMLSNFSLIKWECKDSPEVINLARKLIWIAYNAELEPSKSYDALSAEFDVAYKAIADAEKALYGTVDRHKECEFNRNLETALKTAVKNFQNRMPSVFDPFAGGGGIPLEAARLGCRSYGNDINPVAHVIEKSSAEYPQKFGKPIDFSKEQFEKIYGLLGEKLFKSHQDEDDGWFFENGVYHIPNQLYFDVEYQANRVIEDAEKDAGFLYPKTNSGKNVIAYYWAREVTCANPACNAKVPMLKGFYLASNSRKSIYLSPVIKGNKISFELKNGTCREQGWNNNCNLRCPCCGSVTNSSVLKEESRSKGLKSRVLAVITDGKDGKEYSIPSESQEQELNRVYEILFEPTESLEIEYTQALPCCGWGITKWKDLFTNRQLFTLNAFLKHIKTADLTAFNEEYALAVRTCLSMWFGRVIRYNTSFGNYEPGNEKLNRILVRQEIHMNFDYPESNPFCGVAGSALNQLECVLEYIESESVNPFSAVFVNSSSGEKSQFDAKSINAVVTDPPYYDALAYADLSDFYYAWLKETIGEYYPLIFATPQTPKSDECTALGHHHNNNKSAAETHFEHKLTQIFDAIEVQTRDIVSIMFAHQTTKAWTTLCNAILDARMNITGSWPIDTESKAGLKMDKAFLASSVTVACRPSERKGFGDYNEVKAAIEENVAEEVESLYQLGFRGADLLTACFGQAVSEFGHYKTVEKADGTEVNVAELLELARQSAFDTLLKGVQGDVYTRFYIGWLQMNGAGDADYDDATKFTRVGLPVDIQDILQKGLIVNSKKQIHLAMAQEHLGDKGAVIGTRREDSLIEQVHRAMLLYKSEDRALLLALIKNVAQDENGPFWRLLASLKELLPANDDLKQVEGLLQNAADLRESSKEKPREVIGDLFDTAR